MARDIPFFSVMVPTRNRARLLPYALQSVLDQSFRDFELIVSNNSSSDDTEEIAQNMGAGQIRYFRTDKRLPMHESLEFALGKTSGEWIVYLADDDALYPNALQKIYEVIQQRPTEVVSWNLAGFGLENHPQPEIRGQITLHPGSGRALEISSHAQLRKVFALGAVDPATPRIQNSCCHRRLVERIKADLGCFFFPPSPDYTACASMLARTAMFTYIDLDLVMVGDGAKRNGFAASYGLPSEHPGLSEDFGGKQMFQYVPLSQHTDTNWIAECLLQMKQKMPNELAGCDIDWANYFKGCYFGLAGLEASGLDVAVSWNEYYAALAVQPPEIQARVREYRWFSAARFALHHPRVRPWIVRLGLPWLANRLLPSRKGMRIVRGGGFSDTLDAARYASRSNRI